jgi:hypothetical protein
MRHSPSAISTISDWFKTKLLHQAKVPGIVAWCFDVAEYTADDRSALRLCPWDDLKTALEVLAPISEGKRAFKVDCAEIQAMLISIQNVTLLACWLTGGVLTEMKDREAISDEQYDKEWNETHQHVMAAIERRMKAEGFDPTVGETTTPTKEQINRPVGG